MRKIEELTVPFKEELSNLEIAGIERIISTFDYDVTGLIPDLTLYELAYTSSSRYATYNVTAFYSYEHEGYLYHIDHFAVTTNNMLIMVCEDEDENKHYFEVETSDCTE